MDLIAYRRVLADATIKVATDGLAKEGDSEPAIVDRIGLLKKCGGRLDVLRHRRWCCISPDLCAYSVQAGVTEGNTHKRTKLADSIGLALTKTRVLGRPMRRTLTAPPRTLSLYTSDAADDLTRVDLGGRRLL